LQVLLSGWNLYDSEYDIPGNEIDCCQTNAEEEHSGADYTKVDGNAASFETVAEGAGILSHST
jgi:hypothetical protein